MTKPLNIVSPAFRASHEALQRRRHGSHGAQVVDLARTYTTRAIRKIADLMDGKGGKATVMDKEGNVVEIDIEVPAAVQMKCAEILLERGYGKAPQAIMLKTDSPLALTDGETRDLSVEDKIRLLLESKARGGEVTDLEASEVREGEITDLIIAPSPAGEKRAEKVVEEDEVLAGI